MENGKRDSFKIFHFHRWLANVTKLIINRETKIKQKSKKWKMVKMESANKKVTLWVEEEMLYETNLSLISEQVPLDN